VDVAKVKDRQRLTWGMGDYSPISQMLRPAAVALCDACAVSAGQGVLDVAAGDGNFATAAAREGASVIATDLSPGMVERGRARSQAEGWAIEWREADAEDLPFDDASFDCVGSAFGAMIAPRPRRVAEELFRVVRPGGTVGMTAWTPSSKAVELFSIGRKYQPAPPDLPMAEEWGEEEVVRERFEGLASKIGTEARMLPWEAPSVDEFEAAMGKTPPAAAAREALPDEDLAALRAEQREVIERWSGGGPISIDVEYMQIVARKPG
jgi:SAM-dependent methyltransferase